MAGISAMALSTALVTAIMCFLTSGNKMLTNFLGPEYGEYGGAYSVILAIPALLLGLLTAAMSVTVISNIFAASANKRMQEALDAGKELPVKIEGNIIYYMGPSPAREGRPIGSAGPTTASRMDKYAPGLLDMGLRGMIGKGKRTPQVLDAVVKNHAVYFAAVGGAGAILSKCITSSEVIAYDDLGTEAIRRLHVENFPVIVVADSKGNNLYATAAEAWKRTE